MRLAERVGRNLRRLRQDRGLSQARLAEYAGIATEVVSRFERGAKEPRLSTLERLAQALDVDPSVLFAPDSVDRPVPKRKISSRFAGVDPDVADAVERAALILLRATSRASRKATRR